MKNIPVYEIHHPDYQIDTEPDHEAVGVKVDDFLKEHFMGQHILVRCLSTHEHPGKTVDEMVEIILKLGHDRYDPNREGDRYENNEGRHIDIFAMEYTVAQDSKMFSEFTWPFYHWHIKKIGRPVRIDIIIIYDPTKLLVIPFTYAGREDEGERTDGFVFKDQVNKTNALKAIIKIL